MRSLSSLPGRQRRSVLALAIGTLLFVAAGHTIAQETASFQEIEESLTCQCGCGLTVHSCNHLQCPSALPLRAEIREQLAAGKSKVEILGYFEDKYGEKVLSAPTTSGFNLLAWTTPFLAVLFGATFIVLVVQRWVRRRAQAPVAPTEPGTPPPPPSPYRDILDKELKNFDG